MTRGRALTDEVLARPQPTSVVATHGNLMMLILQSFDPSHDFSAWENLTNPDVFCLVCQGNRVQIFRTWKPSDD